jgi:hypothetical protein
MYLFSCGHRIEVKLDWLLLKDVGVKEMRLEGFREVFVIRRVYW